MSLLTVSEALARDVGIEIPTSVFGSQDRTQQEILEMCNRSGEEIARRVDWGELTKTHTASGDGSDSPISLPADVDRIVSGVGVVTSTGAVVRPLSRAEWTMASVEGTPRYFLLEGTSLRLWPFLANGEDVEVTYQSSFWCDNGTDRYGDDGDAALFDEELILKNAIVRWRRQHGMDYADHEMEYEAALSDFARFNDRSRT